MAPGGAGRRRYLWPGLRQVAAGGLAHPARELTACHRQGQAGDGDRRLLAGALLHGGTELRQPHPLRGADCLQAL